MKIRKTFLAFTIVGLLVFGFAPTAGAQGVDHTLFSLPEWEELELAAQRVEIEISRNRPIAHEDMIEILEEYIEILKERLDLILSDGTLKLVI